MGGEKRNRKDTGRILQVNNGDEKKHTRPYGGDRSGESSKLRTYQAKRLGNYLLNIKEMEDSRWPKRERGMPKENNKKHQQQE